MTEWSQCDTDRGRAHAADALFVPCVGPESHVL